MKLKQFTILLSLIGLLFSAIPQTVSAGGPHWRPQKGPCPTERMLSGKSFYSRYRNQFTIVDECNQDLVIRADNFTLYGSDSGSVNGTITIVGATGVTISGLLVTGSGAGVVGTDSATFTIVDSNISENDDHGIVITKGANGTVTNNIVINNGRAKPPASGAGISVTEGATAHINGNEIADNYSDGVGVYNGSYVRLESNSILRNGRTEVFDAGVQIGRSVVTANGNIYKDNPYAAIEVYNDGSYRTGNFLNTAGNLDNALPFEQIIAGTGANAIDIGRMSYVDIRQVEVQGSVFVGDLSMLQIRGDNVGPDRNCSVVNGDVVAAGFSALARLRDTQVNGFIFGNINGSGLCSF